MLELKGLSKHFGGVRAVDGLDLRVTQGEVFGLIGPNGSGKSTLFEVISGFYRPDAGEVRLDGGRLTGLPPDRVCRLGVARTFQKLRPFAGLTVVDMVKAVDKGAIITDIRIEEKTGGKSGTYRRADA